MTKTVYGPGGIPHDFPDDMDDASIVEVMRRTYGGPGATTQASEPELSAAERAEVERRRRFEGPRQRRISLGVTLGGLDEFVAAGNTAADALRPSFWSGRETLGDRFGSNLRVEQELNRRARAEAGAGFELLGGLGTAAAGAGAQAAAAGAQVVGRLPAMRQFLGEFLKPANLKNTAKIGAGFGATQAALDTDGGLGERAMAVPGGAATGAVGAVALGGLFGSGLAARAGRQAQRAQAAQARQADMNEWEAAGVRPFGPEIADSALIERSAQGLGNTVFGAPVREAAARSIDDTVAGAQRLLGGPTGGRAPADLGQELQGSLRRNLTGYSKSDADLAALDRPALDEITGPLSEMGWKRPAPVVEPTQPRPVAPVAPDYDRYLPGNERIPDVPRQPAFANLDSIPPPPSLARQREAQVNDLQQVARDREAASQLLQRMLPERDSIARRGGLGLLYRDEPARLQSLSREISRLEVNVRGFDQRLEQGRTSIQALDQQIEFARREQWRYLNEQASQRASQEQEQIVRAARNQSARQRAEQVAERETEALRAQAMRDAELDTQGRQVAATAEWQNDRGGALRLGRTRESYPTEASAAYLRLERELPPERFNPLGNRDGGKTSTTEVLNDWFRDAKRSLQLRGVQKPFDDDGRLNKEFASYLQARLGPNSTGVLRRLSEARSAGQGVDATGARLLTSSIGREIGVAREAGTDSPMLKRLYGALREDRYAAMERMGQPREFRTADGTRYVTEMRDDNLVHTTRMGERAPDNTYYVRPEHADMLRGMPVDRIKGADLGFSPNRVVRERRDSNGNRSIGIARGEDNVFDGSTIVPFKTKPDRGLVPVQVFDDGTRTRIGGVIDDMAVPPGQRVAAMDREATETYRQFAEDLRRPLKRIFGDQVTPIEAMDRLSIAAQKGDLRTLNAFMRVMTEKDDPVRAAAAVISHMTKGAPDLKSLLRGLDKMAPESRKALLSSPAAQDWARDLKRIESIGRRLEKYQKGVESGGGLNAVNLVTAGGLLAHPAYAFATAASAFMAAKILASPKYVRWMARVPTAQVVTTSSPEFVRHMNRLAAIAAKDGEFGQAVLDHASNVISISRANAIFLGENARGTDRVALAEAKKMHAQGQSRDDIWRQTGWFVGGDGKWRTEIDDSKIDVSDNYKSAAKKAQETGKDQFMWARGVMDHPKLFDAYPDLGSVPTLVGPMPKGFEDAGGFVLRHPNEMMKLATAPGYSADRTIALHELQHLIQHREGFDYGRLPPNPTGNLLNAGRAYLELPGEAEAYNVAARADMTADDRRENPPWTTLQVPEDSLRWTPRTKRKTKEKSR